MTTVIPRQWRCFILKYISFTTTSVPFKCTVTRRAARLLYPKYGRLFNHVNLCSCACQSSNIQQQESRAVAGVLGLKFANIIHWPKFTIFGLASVPVKILKN